MRTVLLIILCWVSFLSYAQVTESGLRNDGYYVWQGLDRAGEPYWNILIFTKEGTRVDTSGRGEVPVFRTIPLIRSNKMKYTVTGSGSDLHIELDPQLPPYFTGEWTSEMKCRISGDRLIVMASKHTEKRGINKFIHKWNKLADEIYLFVPF